MVHSHSWRYPLMVHSHSCDATPWWSTRTHVTLTHNIQSKQQKSCKCSVCTHSCTALDPLGVSVKSCFVKSFRFTHSEHIWEHCLQTTSPWTVYKQWTNYMSLKQGKSSLDVIQSHPLCGEHYSQYQVLLVPLVWLGDGDCYLIRERQSGEWPWHMYHIV